MTTQPERAYVSFRNVEVRYSDLVFGLRDVSLDIARGDFVFFVGPTGAGKSTMLKLLTREVSESQGQIYFDQRPLHGFHRRDIPRLRRQMGIVPQDFALLPRKLVWENVAYAMRAVGATKREILRRVPEILERVNVAHRADAYPHELSGGEQQRVAIGRALINNPPLLLADEPTGNLDPEHSWEIMELLLNLNLRGTTVIVATHDMMVVERMGRRIVRFENGRVVSDEAANSPYVMSASPRPQRVLVPEPAQPAFAEPIEVQQTDVELEPIVVEAASEPLPLVPSAFAPAPEADDPEDPNRKATPAEIEAVIEEAFEIAREVKRQAEDLAEALDPDPKPKAPVASGYRTQVQPDGTISFVKDLPETSEEKSDA